MTCPKCRCAECRRAKVNNHLRAFLASRETPEEKMWRRFWEEVRKLPPDLRTAIIRSPEELAAVRSKLELARMP